MPFTPGTGTAYPVSLTEIGLAIETTKGTLPSAPTYMVPIKAPKYKPDQAYIPDETLQGSMVSVYDEVQGLRYDSHGWDSFPYLDSFPILVCAELGSQDNLGTAPTATTLAAAATAGATSVSLTGSVVANDAIVIGSGHTQETHIVASVTGAGPYTATLTYPLVYAQASGTTVTGLTSHKFSLLNTAEGQPPSCSIWDNDAEEWRTLSAAQEDELTIKGNATGLVDYTCTWFANAAVTNATAPSVSYTTTRTPPPWTAQVLIGGTAVQTAVDWEYDFKRGVKPIPALTGQQAYFEYFANTLQATAKLTLVEQSGSPYLADYLNGTRQSLDITVFDQQTGDLLNIHSTNAIFTTGELDRGKEWVQVPVDVQLLPSGADALAGGVSPVLITVANAVSTAYYT